MLQGVQAAHKEMRCKMTREEAIKVLRTESVEIGGNAVSVCRFWEALDMAVKALKDVPDKDVWKNTPLTLDELRQMDGEPVYCVEITGREEWLFRRDGGFADMYGEFTSDDFMVWDNYGKLWWCYRQKPEEGTV